MILPIIMIVSGLIGLWCCSWHAGITGQSFFRGMFATRLVFPVMASLVVFMVGTLLLPTTDESTPQEVCTKAGNVWVDGPSLAHIDGHVNTFVISHICMVQVTP
jgi:hypothetical protein